MGVNTKRLNYTKIGKSQNVYKNYPLMMMQAIVILLKPDLILHSVKVTRGTAGRDPRPSNSLMLLRTSLIYIAQ